jgi:hypothetical protein
MPVESLPWSIQGQSHPATVARNAQAGLLGVPAAAVSPAVQILTAGGGHGVVSAGDLAVTQNGTPNMSVNVAAGRAFIRGTETGSLNQGAYSFFNDGAVNLAVAAADPTNPRRDLVIAQVRDSNYSGAVNDARLTVVTGTPAASPSDPTPPANALVLARIAVAAGATSVVTANITDLRTRAAGLGGVQVCTSTTRPSGASLDEGDIIFETDTKELLQYYSAASTFRRPWNMPWGHVASSQSTAAQNGITTVVDLTNLSVTWTAVANRRYRFNYKLEVNGSVAGDLLEVDITNAANGQYDRVLVTVPALNGGAGYFTVAGTLHLISPAAGAQTVKLRGLRNVGTGTLNVNASAAIPAQVFIEDIGPSSATPA